MAKYTNTITIEAGDAHEAQKTFGAIVTLLKYAPSKSLVDLANIVEKNPELAGKAVKALNTYKKFL